VLQPPKKEFLRTQESRVFRFVAVMESRHREDRNRKFVVSVFVPEEMVSIYEPPQRNNGTIGGKFLEKSKILVPGATKQAPKYYVSKDFFVGARVTINAHTFHLMDADEFVFSYLEQNCHKYSVADLPRIMAKVESRGKLPQVMEILQTVPGEPALEALKQAFGENELVLHEVITIYRQKERVLKSDYH
jgi:hypothetical protein